MADFDSALRKVLRHEGVAFDATGYPLPDHTGYSNNPRDNGKETNFGVTIQTARDAGYLGDMKALPYVLAREIYRTSYWMVTRGDEIEDQEIAEEIFDTAVNMGPVTAIRFLQETLNAYNDNGARWADLPVDGLMGPLTANTLKAAIGYSPIYRHGILFCIDALQCVRYIHIRGPWVPAWVDKRCGV